MPSSATAAMSAAMNSWRASGSRLDSGSSRISSRGRLARARVSATWARWPPESLPTLCRGAMSRWPVRSTTCWTPTASTQARLHRPSGSPPDLPVVRDRRAEAQAHLLVRTGERPADPPAGWEAHHIGLEELVLAYLREPGASALPGPRELTGKGVRR